jgi:hypothetical protein
MSLSLLKICQCEEKLYECPYHKKTYEVYLFGSWNNWSKGIKTKEIRRETYPNEECVTEKTCGPIYKDFYKAKLPKNLKKGNYEYKWQITNTETNEIFWLIDTTKKTVENEGWNKNNLYVKL